ncbi:Ankyrin repeat protein [Pandoravirus kuranda]|uniref:Ankyrin repeat protein n=2 Tax=Pandoravirus TaxID=2060084 RepID=A0AA95EEM1_9VIRU|nr:Ankyrin repeat domain containing protein [Pandoravirus neocaledonia]AVK76109.1 Ankyrin repeat domain containing protein [Pandoravirus neocaledonia]WBR14642.1 Ankyrin repeat protein [Pandoravirus kuranda]
MATAPTLGIADLPNEIVCRIIDLLDDASFCTARAAHNLFRVHSRDEIHAKRRVPRWLADRPQRYIERGHVEAVEAWKARGHRFTSWDMMCAVESGSVDIVALLYEGCIADCETEDVDLFASAAPHGHLAVIRVLHERGSLCTTRAMDYAAASGHLPVVEFLHNNRTEGCTKEALHESAMNGHLDIVKFLCTNRNECRIAEVLLSISWFNRRPPPDVVAYLAQQYLEPNMSLTTRERLLPDELAPVLDIVAGVPGHSATAAALADSIAYYEREGAHDYFASAARAAAATGIVDTVRVLIPRCGDWEARGILATAAEHGHTDVVCAMLGDDCTIQAPAALALAASNGHTGVLRLLLSLDCARDWLHDAECANALVSAAIGGHLDTLAFLCSHMHLVGADTREPTAYAKAVRGAAASKHADCVRFLVSTAGGDALVARAMEDCVANGQTDALRLLFDLYGTDLVAECAIESIHEPSDYLSRLRALCSRPKIVAIDLDVRNCRCAPSCRFALLGKAASSRNKDALDLLCKTWLQP